MFLRLLTSTIAVVFFAGILFQARPALAQSEEERREGFYRHQKEQKERELEREKGLRDFLKEQAAWEEQRQHDKNADKKRKITESPKEGGPEYKADRKNKLEEYEEFVQKRHAYMKEKKSHEAKSAKDQEKRDAWAMEEYGLDQERPRFDVAKRNFTGSKTTLRTTPSSGGGSGRGNSNFPPPPSYDDFGEGYIPPPPPPPEIFDAPPPEAFPVPPPPFPPAGGDFDNGNFFPPPPPPQMDSFDDGF